MAVISASIGGINPQPRTPGETLRNWQRLAAVFSQVGGGLSLDADGRPSVATNLHFVVPPYLIATGNPGGAGSLTSLNGTLTLTNATQNAHTFLAGGTDSVYRVIAPLDLATGPTDTYVLTIAGGAMIWGPPTGGTGGYIDPPPTFDSDPGTAGQYAADSSWFYICIATDTWRRVAVSTFAMPGGFTDTFTRADGAVGNNWVDLTATGSIYAIASNLLTAGVDVDFLNNWLYRQSSEDQEDVTVSAWVTAGASGIAVVLARAIAAPNKAYAAYIDGSNLKVAFFDTGSQTILNSVSAATTAGVEYIVKLAVLTTGPGTTDLVATVAASATPLTIIATNTVTGDTTAAMQGLAAAAGIATYNASSWSKFTWTSP